MDEATRICARLLREGSFARIEAPGLDHPSVRHEVERRLLAVGLVLAVSPSSEHVGIRLSPEVAGDPAFDAASNLGLQSDACALLVILWSRLVLRQRTGADSPEPHGGSTTRPRLAVETLVRDFRSVFGGRSRVQGLVAQLRRLGFLGGQGEIIEAGPLLEVAIDGEKMVGFLRREVLAQLVAEHEHGYPSAGEAPDSGAELLSGFGGRVLDAIGRLGGTAAMGDLSRLMDAPASRLRRVLKELEVAGLVRRTGERAGARYHLVRALQEPG